MANQLFSFISETPQESIKSSLKYLGYTNIILAQKSNEVKEVKKMFLGVKTEKESNADLIELQKKVEELKQQLSIKDEAINRKNLVIETLLDQLSEFQNVKVGA